MHNIGSAAHTLFDCFMLDCTSDKFRHFVVRNDAFLLSDKAFRFLMMYGFYKNSFTGSTGVEWDRDIRKNGLMAPIMHPPEPDCFKSKTQVEYK